ncbi:hypothetical protein [Neotabrizicola sp. VNH66]|uniref:hypothetical protein n=1 Tax=Neotabrizicola sp. VNH66 TaxID=3400918 RepID=UPI003C0DF3F2
MELILQLIAGAVGGNLAGKGVKPVDMGTLLNTVVGLVGGLGGGQLLGMLGLTGAGEAAAAAGNLDIAAIVQSILGGGVGGGALVAIIGTLKKALVK